MIFDAPPAQPVFSLQDPPVCSAERFAIFYIEQPPIVVEKRDRPQSSVWVVNVIVPNSLFLKPLGIPLDVHGHVIVGAEWDVEPLGQVVPSHIDYFGCVGYWWCCADDL